MPNSAAVDDSVLDNTALDKLMKSKSTQKNRGKAARAGKNEKSLAATTDHDETTVYPVSEVEPSTCTASPR